MNDLQRFIKLLLESLKDDEELLLDEPDLSNSDEEEKEEVSTAGAVAGVTTPLGTNATYPAKDTRKRPKRKVVDIIRGAFGGTN